VGLFVLQSSVSRLCFWKLHPTAALALPSPCSGTVLTSLPANAWAASPLERNSWLLLLAAAGSGGLTADSAVGLLLAPGRTAAGVLLLDEMGEVIEVVLPAGAGTAGGVPPHLSLTAAPSLSESGPAGAMLLMSLSSVCGTSSPSMLLPLAREIRESARPCRLLLIPAYKA